MTLLQIMVTVWVGAHPVIYMLPQQYPLMSDSCKLAADRLFHHRKPHSYKRLRIECIPAVGSLA